MSYLRMDCSTQSEGRKDIRGSCSGTGFAVGLAAVGVRLFLSCSLNLSLTVGLSRKYSFGV